MRFFPSLWAGSAGCSDTSGAFVMWRSGQLIKAINSWTVLFVHRTTYHSAGWQRPPAAPPLPSVLFLYLTSNQGVITGTKRVSSCFHLRGESDENVFALFVVKVPQRLQKWIGKDWEHRVVGLNPKSFRDEMVECFSSSFSQKHCQASFWVFTSFMFAFLRRFPWILLDLFFLYLNQADIIYNAFLLLMLILQNDIFSFFLLT